MNLRHSSSVARQTAFWRQHLAGPRDQAMQWWAVRTPRERMLLRVGMALAVAALIWTQALQPSLTTIEQSRELLPRLHANAAQVDALILESQALQRQQSGKIAPAAMSDALNDSLRRAGLEAAAALTEIRPPSDGPSRHWELVLNNASAARVMEWLSSLPYLLRLQTLSVELMRANVDGRDRPGHVSGRIVVRQPPEPTQ